MERKIMAKGGIFPYKETLKKLIGETPPELYQSLLVVVEDTDRGIDFYIDNVEPSKKFGRFVASKEEENLDENYIRYALSKNEMIRFTLDGISRNSFKLIYEMPDEYADFFGVNSKEAVNTRSPSTRYDAPAMKAEFDRILAMHVIDEDNLKRAVDCMRDNDFPEESVIATLAQWKIHTFRDGRIAPVHIPKVVYANPYKGENRKSPLHEAWEQWVCGNHAVYNGVRSTGKNVCAETLAFITGNPYYLLGISSDMTSEDFTGGKVTDNSAIEKLSSDLGTEFVTYGMETAPNYRVMYFCTKLKQMANNALSCFNRKGLSADADQKAATEEMNKLKELRKKAGEFEYLKAKAASVSIVQGYSPLLSALETGGILMLNEWNMGDPNLLQQYVNPIADGTGFISIPGLGRIDIPEGFYLVCSQNPPDYEGTNTMNEATKSRLAYLDFPAAASIINQMKAAAPGLTDIYYEKVDGFYKAIMDDTDKSSKNLPLGMDAFLNQRGFERALKACKTLGKATTLRDQISIQVIRGVEDPDLIAAGLVLLKSKIDI